MHVRPEPNEVDIDREGVTRGRSIATLSRSDAQSDFDQPQPHDYLRGPGFRVKNSPTVD